MNVIFYGSFLYPNGYAATKRKQQFIDYLLAQGSLVRVILSDKKARGHNMNPFEGTHNGVSYEVVNKYTSSKILSYVISPFITSMLICMFKRYYKRNDRNIVVNFGISSLRSLIVNTYCKRIGYLVFNDVVEDFSCSGVPLKKRLRYMLWGENISRFASRNLVTSTSVISRLLFDKYLAYVKDASRIMMVPISAENIDFYSAKPTHSQTYFIFQYSGTYGTKERLDLLAKALGEIRQDRKKICLRLTGNCPVYIKEMMHKLSGKVFVEYTGRLPDTEYYESLHQANVLLMIRSGSDYANTGFPYKLGEYLATANPVVCTKVSDVCKYLDDSSAVLIPPDDYNAMLKSLTDIYNNYTEYISIGEKGRAVCKKYFNPENNSKTFYNMLSLASYR